MNWKSIKRYLSTPAVMLVLVFLVLLTVLVIFLLTRGGDSSQNSEQPTEGLSEELSPKEYQEYKSEFFKLTNEQNPRVALTALRKLVAQDDALARSCHSLAHQIGQESFKKYGDFAQSVSYQDEICNSGYLHGVIEAYFRNSKDITADLRKVCLPYPENKYLGWECYHGIGHGLMYFSSNDLPKSIAGCEALASSFGRSACVNGVYMENFTSDPSQKGHASKYLKKDDPFYPCKEQKAGYKPDCYIYAPAYYLSLNKNQYSKALKWCESAEENYRSTCSKGVGSQAIKENINNPSLVESQCKTARSEFIDNCIEGMASLYLFHSGQLQAAKDMCAKLSQAGQTPCTKTVNSYSSYF